MIFHLYAFVLGTVLGSFYGVVASRVPLQKSIVIPRSHCPHCSHTLHVVELIPIISFCVQKGRCTHCNNKISYFYPLAEAVTGFAFLIPTFFISSYVQLIVIWTLLSLLIIITMTDLLYMLIPNAILLFFTMLFLLEHIFLLRELWWNRLIGSVCIFLLLYLIHCMYAKGIGGGDVKLLTLLAFIIGIEGFLLSICFASLLGLCFIFIASFFGYIQYKQPIPFAPFISAGTICSLIILYN